MFTFLTWKRLWESILSFHYFEHVRTGSQDVFCKVKMQIISSTSTAHRMYHAWIRVRHGEIASEIKEWARKDACKAQAYVHPTYQIMDRPLSILSLRYETILINYITGKKPAPTIYLVYWQGCKTNIAIPRYGAITADGNQVDRYESINNHYDAADIHVSRWNLCPWKYRHRLGSGSKHYWPLEFPHCKFRTDRIRLRV